MTLNWPTPHWLRPSNEIVGHSFIFLSSWLNLTKTLEYSTHLFLAIVVAQWLSARLMINNSCGRILTGALLFSHLFLSLSVVRYLEEEQLLIFQQNGSLVVQRGMN